MAKVKWERLGHPRKLISGATLFAALAAVMTVFALIVLTTGWVPPVKGVEWPMVVVAALFTVIGFRMRIAGCYVSEIGVRNRWEFGTSTVPWADIDHFEIRLSKVAGMRLAPIQAAWMILKDGRAKHTMLWYRALSIDNTLDPADETHMNILPRKQFMKAYDRLREMHAARDRSCP